MYRQLLCAAAAAVLLTTPAASAQESAPWTGRVFVTLDVPFQPLDNAFTEAVSVADAIAKTEKDSFTASYPANRGVLVDAGVGIRLAGSFGVGVTGSYLSRSSSADFALSVANPALANTPRVLTGSAASLAHTETAVHLQALYAMRLGSKGRVMLSAGPTIVRINQDLIQGVQFNEVAGFSKITLGTVLTAPVTQTVLGFNVGADTTWPIARHLGLGTTTRYSRATTTVDPGSATTGLTRSVELQAGGLHLGAGLRFLF